MITDERFAEQYLPGGEPVYPDHVHPALVDFECGECKRVGGTHEPGCSYNTMEETMNAVTHDTPCKVDGCDGTAVQQFGKYGGLCETHRPAKAEKVEQGDAEQNGNGKLSSVPAWVAAADRDADLPEALRAEIRVVRTDDPGLDRLDAIVTSCHRRIDAVIAEAAAELAELLRERVRERLAQ